MFAPPDFAEGVIVVNAGRRVRWGVLCVALLVPAMFGVSAASATTTTQTLGNATGATVSSLCPAGSAMTGIRGYNDPRGYVGGAAAICAGGSIGTAFGATGGQTTDSSCTGTVVGVGIYGRSGEIVDAAGIRCGTSAAATNAPLVGGSGGGAQGPFDCPAGSQLVGVQGTAGDYFGATVVRSLTGVCDQISGSPPSGTCEKRVVFGLVDARTTGCLNKINATQWETSDLVNLNGLPLPVVPGTKLMLTAPSTDAPGGKIAVTTTISLGGVITLKQQLISTKLPAGGSGEEKDLLSLEPAANQKFLGFSVGGKVALRIGKDADGTGFSRLVLVLALPSIFKNGPAANAGGLTATVAIRADFTGVRTDALKLEIANAFIGQTEVKSLCLSYTGVGSLTNPCMPPAFGAMPLLMCASGTDQARWDGSAVITLPTTARPQLGLFAGIKGGAFSYGGAQVTNLGNSITIATGVFLDKFGLGVCLNPAPLKIKGAAGIRFGPVVAGKSAAYLDASLEYVDSRPWVLTATGNLALFDQNVANGYLKVQSSGAVDFGFDASLNFVGGLLVVNGKVAGWYQPAGNKFDVFGSASVCVAKIVCTGGEAAVSSVGVAGCADLLTLGYPEPYWLGVRWVTVKVRAGGGYKWATKKVDVMGTSCGTGSYRAHKSADTAAGGSRTITLRASPATVLRMVGRAAPPKVQLVRPNGRVIRLDATGAFQAGNYLYAEDVADNSTEITLAKPAPGTWRIQVLPDSTPLVSVSDAIVEPPASAAGSVTGLGTTRTLHYIFEHQPNQKIEFVERGTTYERVIGTAAGGKCSVGIPATPKGDMPANPTLTCGTIAFHPAPGPAGRRDIVGVVTNLDEATREIHVASYTAPPTPKLAAPAHVTIARNGTAVTVSWGPVPGTKTYDVAIALNDGEQVVQDSAQQPAEHGHHRPGGEGRPDHRDRPRGELPGDRRLGGDGRVRRSPRRRGPGSRSLRRSPDRPGSAGLDRRSRPLPRFPASAAPLGGRSRWAMAGGRPGAT